MTNSLDRSQLAHLILRYASSGDSGTLMISSGDGHAASLTFNKGRVIALSYGGHRGSEAVAQLSNFNIGTYSFTEKQLGSEQQGIPSATEISHLLINNEPAAEEKPTGKSGFSNPDQLTKEVSELLTTYLGPISHTLCNKIIADMGGINNQEDADHLITKLAQEISETGSRNRFLTSAAKLINLLK